jgi:hypothetical protein
LVWVLLTIWQSLTGKDRAWLATQTKKWIQIPH